jgi:hypothetical protein
MSAEKVLALFPFIVRKDDIWRIVLMELQCVAPFPSAIKMCEEGITAFLADFAYIVLT